MYCSTQLYFFTINVSNIKKILWYTIVVNFTHQCYLAIPHLLAKESHSVIKKMILWRPQSEILVTILEVCTCTISFSISAEEQSFHAAKTSPVIFRAKNRYNMISFASASSKYQFLKLAQNIQSIIDVQRIFQLTRTRLAMFFI